MRDALGGTVVLIIIVVFIVFVSGYMAFNVNYTKAFRMKNKIVDSINKYGDCCFSGDVQDKNNKKTCYGEIMDYAKSIGYDPISLKCSDGSSAGIYCYEKHEKTSAGDDVVEKNDAHYYTITTKVDINIFLINDILDLRFLTVTGDTRTFSKNDVVCS